VIVTEHTVEARQDADRIHRLLTSLCMGRKPGQSVIRRAVRMEGATVVPAWSRYRTFASAASTSMLLIFMSLSTVE